MMIRRNVCHCVNIQPRFEEGFIDRSIFGDESAEMLTNTTWVSGEQKILEKYFNMRGILLSYTSFMLKANYIRPFFFKENTVRGTSNLDIPQQLGVNGLSLKNGKTVTTTY